MRLVRAVQHCAGHSLIRRVVAAASTLPLLFAALSGSSYYIAELDTNPLDALKRESSAEYIVIASAVLARQFAHFI